MSDERTKEAMKRRSAELAYLENLADEDIDLSDGPEITDWTGAVRGMFYRPEKQSVTIRLDADVVAWFKSSEPKYQTAVNRVLRDYMLSHRKSA
ncbi:MAG: BrnA antitoxin family protein [Brevundimonas sp.]|nr:BrnA antitoxin family protein [Brevundimonas sp.]